MYHLDITFHSKTHLFIIQQIQTISERLNQEFGPALFNDATQTIAATSDQQVNAVESETMGIIDMMNRRMNSTTTTSAPMRQHRPRRPMGGGGGGHHGGDGKPSYRSQRGDPPPGYVCHRCHVSGHWIQDCPTNGDPKFDKKHRSQNMRSCNLPGLVSIDYMEYILWCVISGWSLTLSVSVYWLLLCHCVNVYRVSHIFLLPIFAMYCRFGCDSFVKLISYFEALFSGIPMKYTHSLPPPLSNDAPKCHYEITFMLSPPIKENDFLDVNGMTVPCSRPKPCNMTNELCCDLIY